MPADTLSPANEATEATASAKRAAKAAVAGALDSSQDKINDALDAAERSLNEAAKRVERVLRDGVEALKAQTQPLRDNAGQQLDEAQKYVLERVKERPVTATLAGLGVGLLLGLLLSNRSGK
jgi:ElaB/YqjD/DUF883 family membrane-anchored ribosome-binding protein